MKRYYKHLNYTKNKNAMMLFYWLTHSGYHRQLIIKNILDRIKSSKFDTYLLQLEISLSKFPVEKASN